MDYVLVDISDGDIGMFRDVNQFEAEFEPADFVGREKFCRFFDSTGREYGLSLNSSEATAKRFRFFSISNSRVTVDPEPIGIDPDFLRRALIDRGGLDSLLPLPDVVEEFRQKFGYGWT